MFKDRSAKNTPGYFSPTGKKKKSASTLQKKDSASHTSKKK